MQGELVLKVNDIEKARRKLYQLFLENDRKDYLSGENQDFLSLENEPIFATAGSSITVELQTPDGLPIPVAALGYHCFAGQLRFRSSPR